MSSNRWTHSASADQGVIDWCRGCGDRYRLDDDGLCLRCYSAAFMVKVYVDGLEAVTDYVDGLS